MGKRKPAIMLTAGTLAVATLLSVGVTANAIENIPTPTATQSESRTASIYPEGAWISVDGEWLESFDPSDGLDDEDTSYVDSATWNVKGGSIQLHDLPAGWTVGTQMRLVSRERYSSSQSSVMPNLQTLYAWLVCLASMVTR